MRKLKTLLLAFLTGAVLTFSGCENVPVEEVVDVLLEAAEQAAEEATVSGDKLPPNGGKGETSAAGAVFSMDQVPEYSGDPYVIVNGNVPYFTEDELTAESFEFYSDLDSLGRCGVTIASIGKDLMPTEKRESISHVKPTGWQTAKYDSVEGKYLYNRCHLIGFQLAGENANEKNLITGTRAMNVDGMLPFENMVADFVKETGDHVLYRVTPIFEGDNLVADGVLMEAQSVEDAGEGVLFCVFAYNAQPGIQIDYATGLSSLASGGKGNVSNVKAEYVINTGTKKFHLPSCSSVTEMQESKRKDFTGTREDLIAQGYEPCGRCHP